MTFNRRCDAKLSKSEKWKNLKCKKKRRTKFSGGTNCSTNEDESNLSSSVTDSDNDPEKLWCICRQPYDKRFMICCDLCDEWYHGDCVGIKPKEGRRMERQSTEFICASCKSMSDYTTQRTDNILDYENSPNNLTANIVNSLRLRLTEEASRESDYGESVNLSFCGSVELTQSSEEHKLSLELTNSGAGSKFQVNMDSEQFRRRKRRMISRISSASSSLPSISLLDGTAVSHIGKKSHYCPNAGYLELSDSHVIYIQSSCEDNTVPSTIQHCNNIDHHRRKSVDDTDVATAIIHASSDESNQIKANEMLESLTHASILDNKQLLAIDQCRQKNRAMLLSAFEKRIQTSRHLFTTSRTQLQILVHELESLCANQHDLISFLPDTLHGSTDNHSLNIGSTTTTSTGSINATNKSIENNMTAYKCQLNLFRNHLSGGAATNVNTTVTNTNTDSVGLRYRKSKLSNWLCDQFFHLLLTGHIKPIELVHCVNAKDIITLIERATMIEARRMQKSIGCGANSNMMKKDNLTSENPNIDVFPHSSSTNDTIITNMYGTMSTNKYANSGLFTNTITANNGAKNQTFLDTTTEHNKHLYDIHCKYCLLQETKKQNKCKQLNVNTVVPCSIVTLKPAINSVTNVTSRYNSNVNRKFSPHLQPRSQSKATAYQLNGIESIEYANCTKMNVQQNGRCFLQPAYTKQRSVCSGYNISKRTTSAVDTKYNVSIHSKYRRTPISDVTSGIKPAIYVDTTSLMDDMLNKSSISFTTTGLLDLPLPHPNDDENQTTGQNNNSVENGKNTTSNPLSGQVIWSGEICLNTDETVYRLQVRAAAYGYICAKQFVSCSASQLVKVIVSTPSVTTTSPTTGNADTSWRSLHLYQAKCDQYPTLQQQPTCFVIKHGVDLSSLPVYFSQVLLDSTNPKELFALRLTSTSRSVYRKIYQHLMKINACGNLEPRLYGICDCLLYPMRSDQSFYEQLLSSDDVMPPLMDRFDCIVSNPAVADSVPHACTLSEPTLLIILTRPISTAYHPSQVKVNSTRNLCGIQSVANVRTPTSALTTIASATEMTATPTATKTTISDTLISNDNDITVQTSHNNDRQDLDLRHSKSYEDHWLIFGSGDVDYRVLNNYSTLSAMNSQPVVSDDASNNVTTNTKAYKPRDDIIIPRLNSTSLLPTPSFQAYDPRCHLPSTARAATVVHRHSLLPRRRNHFRHVDQYCD